MNSNPNVVVELNPDDYAVIRKDQVTPMANWSLSEQDVEHAKAKGLQYILHKNPHTRAVRLYDINSGIEVEMVMASQCEATKGIVRTFSVSYWLMIHAEFLRHRMLSRGVKSNRAIPTKRIRQEVLDRPYSPIFFGRNQSGMVANNAASSFCGKAWRAARYPAVAAHWFFDRVLGGHKEWVNRILAPWQYVRETITATEWDNVFSLRIHKDAQRDIREVVRMMHYLCKIFHCEPTPLVQGDVHVPYVYRKRDEKARLHYYSDPTFSEEIDKETAMKCSAARCARSSYDNHDNTSVTVSKDLALFERLIESKPAHASPVEHQAICWGSRAIQAGRYEGLEGMLVGATHRDKYGSFWSGNFRGWGQYRQTIAGHNCTEFKY